MYAMAPIPTESVTRSSANRQQLPTGCLQKLVASRYTMWRRRTCYDPAQ